MKTICEVSLANTRGSCGGGRSTVKTLAPLVRRAREAHIVSCGPQGRHSRKVYTYL